MWEMCFTLARDTSNVGDLTAKAFALGIGFGLFILMQKTQK